MNELAMMENFLKKQIKNQFVFEFHPSVIWALLIEWAIGNMAMKAELQIPLDSGVRPLNVNFSPCWVFATPGQIPESERTSIASHLIEWIVIFFLLVA